MIVPIFGCTQMQKAVAFYQTIFDCVVLARFQIDENAPDPAYTTLSFRGDHLHLTSFPANQGEGKSAYVYVDDVEEVDALYNKVKDHPGINMRVPLCDQSWGMREFGFDDPFGNTLSVGAQLTKTPPTTPAR